MRVRKAIAVAAVAAALLAVPVTAAHADDPGATPTATASSAPADPTDSPTPTADPTDSATDPSASPTDASTDSPAPKDAPPESTADTNPPAPAPSSAQGTMDKLDKIADDHRALGVFGDASAPVVVMPSGTSSDEEAAVNAELPSDSHATVQISQFTKDALDALQKTVTDRKWAPDADTYGVAVAYDAVNDKVQVKSDAPDSALQQLSDDHPGQIETSQSRLEPQNTRFADWSPFWGGDALIGANGGNQCTGGFMVVNRDGRHELVTAAHCYGWWNQVYNRTYNGGYGNAVGQVSKRDNTIDAEEIVDKDYAPIIYTGGTQISGSSLRVFGKQPVYYGLRVCVSGAVSFNHCGHPISQGEFNICWSGTDVCIKNNAGFVFETGGNNFPRYNNGPQTKPGDSGAPIYMTDYSGTAAWIVGLNAGAYWDCCGQYRGQIHMVGVNLDYILGSFGAELVTTH
ncbi:hypothetical protein [Streptomyces graminilatus]|uniref:hypothetical protein n=1 Tax=Streptomyces graminilatus TaxID=1464070 RepID=UPI0006E1C435|nr:hypothetical protein [Streptomyces graminilatus]